MTIKTSKKRAALRTPRNARRSTSAQETIKDARRQLKLSQAQMAMELGVTDISVSRWENGHIRPPKMALLSVEYLIHRQSCHALTS